MNFNTPSPLFLPNRTAINGWLLQPCSHTAELMSRQEFDSLTIDMQHGLIGYESALTMLQAMAASSVTPIVRIPWLEPGIIMKMLDAGACGIICPMIETAAQAQEFVSSCYYPPAGQRSFGPVRASLCYGEDYARKAAETVLPIVMIETRAALNNLAAILEVEGLAGVYIGPFDLSYALGCRPEADKYEQPVLDAVDYILDHCQQRSVPVGIHCISADYAAKMREKGFSLVTAGCDMDFIKLGCAQVFRTLG